MKSSPNGLDVCVGVRARVLVCVHTYSSYVRACAHVRMQLVQKIVCTSETVLTSEKQKRVCTTRLSSSVNSLHFHGYHSRRLYPLPECPIPKIVCTSNVFNSENGMHFEGFQSGK